ncbi:Crp/Fnr family transcriptional regulator [Caldanaerobius polysaccharolyticus]|uniref:Crp/Fnr family transcriptional regulator n=1 Tax=Caldanaerobius polysaccharolyticus TaxID=44256 RepID=UPI00047B820E|nr:Crp/Fnr family transcriptional regulator [Caldanaerobius polysaccharolyticus]
MEKWEYLRRIPLFSDLKEALIKQIADIATIKNVKEGTIIFQQGDPGEAVYVVKEGSVKISMVDEDGKEYIIHIMKEGEVFAEATLFNSGPYPANAEAVDDAALIVLNNAKLEDLIKSNSELALELIKVMAKRLQDVSKQINSLALRDAIGRTISVLIRLAEEKGEKVEKGVVIKDISRQDLASMVGTTRETVTRILNQMSRGKLLELDRQKIIIKDVRMLNSYLR